MGKFSDSLQPAHTAFIEKQKMFFVATAPLAANGHINLSPKGLDSFRVLSPNQVIYLDITGSGNETSAHILENGRITLMFCAFDGPPNILRLYGIGTTILPHHPLFEEYLALFPDAPGIRQMILTDVHKVQTSCGYTVPLYEYAGERDHAWKWVEKKGADGLVQYRNDNNTTSMDGLPTAIGQL